VENNIFYFVEECEKIYEVAVFLLGDSPACEIYVPTFRNNLFRLHSWCTIDGYGPESRHNIQTPGNNSKERIQHSEHGQSLKSIKYKVVTTLENSLFVYCVDNYYIGLVDIRTIEEETKEGIALGTKAYYGNLKVF
jgi:hypothetical protein